MSSRRARRRWSALVAAALLLGACTGAATPEDEAAVGGGDRLPGPVPEDVTFAEPPETAPPAPVVELELLDGTAVTGEELWEDRPVILHFFASWCELCQDQQADLNAVAREYGDAIAFLGVAGSDELENVERYLRERDVPYAAGLDPELEVWLRYGVSEPPLVALIARGGTIVRGFPSGLDGERLREVIESDLLAD